MSYFIFISSIVFFGVVHSITASNQLKSIVAVKYYRLIYNGLALITFGLVYWAYTQTPVDFIMAQTSYLLVGNLVIAFAILGVGYVLWGYDLQDFSGLDALSEQDLVPSLKTDGLLQYVRHPLYLALIVLFTGIFLTELSYRNLFGGLAFVGYILIGIYFEERKLVQVFGDAYRQYQSKTPMLFPIKF